MRSLGALHTQKGLCKAPITEGDLHIQRGFAKPKGGAYTYTYTHIHIWSFFLQALMVLHKAPIQRGIAKPLWQRVLSIYRGTLQSPKGPHTHTHIFTFGLFPYKHWRYFTKFLYTGGFAKPLYRVGFAYTEGLCKAQGSLIHQNIPTYSYLVFFPPNIGCALQSSYTQGALQSPYIEGALQIQKRLSTSIHTFQSFLLQIRGCFMKPLYQGSFAHTEECGSGTKIFCARNCITCSNLHRKIMLLAPTQWRWGWVK